MASLENREGVKYKSTKPQVDRFTYPDGLGVPLLAADRLLNIHVLHDWSVRRQLLFRLFGL